MRYSLDSLEALLPTEQPKRVYTPPSHIQAQATRSAYEGDRPIDAFNAAHNIVDLLTKYGYTQNYGVKWSRPGTTDRCVTVFPETNTLLTRSHNDPGYNNLRVTDCFCLYRIWEHGGDMKAAIEGARALLGMEKKSYAPDPTFSERIAAIREWVVGADFSQIIPKHLQSAKGYRTAATDKRAFDACLDIFEQYGKFDGPISKMQGSRASGLSENTFRSAMKRLEQSPLLDRMTPTEQVQDGAFWYSMTVAYLDRVCCSKEALATRSTYATVFSEHKAEDAWQLTGSKYQRALAKLDKSCGPDMLLAVAVLPVGERVHQAVFGEWIHKNKSATSRLVKKMEYFSIVSTEHIGRQQYITLLPDWQERIAQLVDFMPTAGNRTRREWGLDTRLVERIDKKLGLKAGNPVRLLAQREQAMRRLTAIMESDMQGMDADLMAEKMRRLLRADSLRRNASAEKKTVKTLDVATHRNNQAKAPWLSKNSPAVERRVNELMQELEENEMLIEARAELRRAA